jgi:hypothetical protein
MTWFWLWLCAYLAWFFYAAGFHDDIIQHYKESK